MCFLWPSWRTNNVYALRSPAAVSEVSYGGIRKCYCQPLPKPTRYASLELIEIDATVLDRAAQPSRQKSGIWTRFTWQEHFAGWRAQAKRSLGLGRITIGRLRWGRRPTGFLFWVRRSSEMTIEFLKPVGLVALAHKHDHLSLNAGCATICIRRQNPSISTRQSKQADETGTTRPFWDRS
jgi:hypothetical protein